MVEKLKKGVADEPGRYHFLLRMENIVVVTLKNNKDHL